METIIIDGDNEQESEIFQEMDVDPNDIVPKTNLTWVVVLLRFVLNRFVGLMHRLRDFEGIWFKLLNLNKIFSVNWTQGNCDFKNLQMFFVVNVTNMQYFSRAFRHYQIFVYSKQFYIFLLIKFCLISIIRQIVGNIATYHQFPLIYHFSFDSGFAQVGERSITF